jgi:hypothetical protein
MQIGAKSDGSGIDIGVQAYKHIHAFQVNVILAKIFCFREKVLMRIVVAVPHKLLI